MERHVTAHLEATVTSETDAVLAIAVDGRYERTGEELTIRFDTNGLESALLSTGTSGRLHLLSGIPPQRW